MKFKKYHRPAWLTCCCLVMMTTISAEIVFDDKKLDFAKISVLPNDAPAGYAVKNLNEHLNNHSQSYKLLNTKYSDYFTVLKDGLVMTTGDLSPLTNRPINLQVLEKSENGTSRRDLRLYVVNRKDMLQFTNLDGIIGEISESAQPGARVQNLPMLRAASLSRKSPLVYSIVRGNENATFALEDDPEYGPGVWLVLRNPVDYETKNRYLLTLQANDAQGINKALVDVDIKVVNINDNNPVFEKTVYRFIVRGYRRENETVLYKRFETVGTVKAYDKDGDKIVYKLANPSNIFVIVPQTGDILLVDQPTEDEYVLAVQAHDLGEPKTRFSKRSASVVIDFKPPLNEKLNKDFELEQEDLDVEESQFLKYARHDIKLQELSHEHDDGLNDVLDKGDELRDILSDSKRPDKDYYDDEEEVYTNRLKSGVEHVRHKRRVTRAVRPTKRIEFAESDGDLEGRSVFQLEKETDRETFKIRDENAWVTVEPNGAVRVKKRWDYEELGPDKTIDFWVTIHNNGTKNGGKIYLFVTL